MVGRRVSEGMKVWAADRVGEVAGVAVEGYDEVSLRVVLEDLEGGR